MPMASLPVLQLLDLVPGPTHSLQSVFGVCVELHSKKEDSRPTRPNGEVFRFRVGPASFPPFSVYDRPRGTTK